MSEAYGIVKSSSDGSALSGVKVILQDPQGNQITSDTTDSGGNFSITSDSVDNTSSSLLFQKSNYLQTTYPSNTFVNGGTVDLDPSTTQGTIPSWLYVVIGIAALGIIFYIIKHVKK